MIISEVSEQFGLTPDTLRYYERIGLIPPVERNSAGIRDYRQVDCNRVGFIKCMRSAGLPIEALSEYVSLSMDGEETEQRRKLILIKQRDELSARIEQMQKTRELLTWKIDNYNEITHGCEKALRVNVKP